MNILDIFLDALIDCAKLLPFLLLTIFLMEYIEHRAGEKLATSIQKAGRFGPLVGAGIGCVPQCGFSAACAQLFNGGLVSAGTLVAVFLSTSDEALPILIANPSGWSSVWKLIATKVLIAIVAGFVLDLIWRPEKQQAAYRETATPHHCHSDGNVWNILWAAVKRTVSIFLFLLLFSFALGFIVEAVGEERLAAMLLPGPFQPLLAGIVGFLPNCAASVLLTQLYMEGIITFGSAIAGLCTASGIGIIVLLRGKRGFKTYAAVLGTTYIAGVVIGSILQWIG